LHADLEALFGVIDADRSSVLNVETHAGHGSASVDEVRDALIRARRLDERLTCSSCATRIWAIGTAPAATCKYGKVRLDGAAAS
jgi:hypothetical protein